MLKGNRMKKQIILLLFVTVNSVSTYAGGISVDAGITPPQDRFILRYQYRYMSMENSMMTKRTQMTPIVLAYGVTSGITILARGMYVHQSVSNNSEIKNGFNDLYLLSKFRLFRRNTANYVFGIAPHIATNIPIGSKEISTRTWNTELGLNISYRPRFLAFDISASYSIADITGKLDGEQGNTFNLNTAASGLIPLKTETSSVLSPVLEMTYTFKEDSENSPDNELMFLSPGLSFIYSDLTLETLFQFPVYQNKNMNVMDQNSRIIIGLKYMF